MQAERKENLEKAISAVRQGRLKLFQACKEFAIPKSTLRDHLKKTTGPGSTTSVRRKGHGHILTEAEELGLVAYVEYMANQGFPMTRSILRCYIREIVRRSGREINMNLDMGPSDKWFRKLLKRHPQLSERTPENLDKARQRMSTQQTADNWFAFLKDVLHTSGVTNKPAQNVDGDDKLYITFDYSHNGGVLRTFNSVRPKSEEISRALARLSANVDKKVNKKKRKKQEATSEDPDVPMQVLSAGGQSIVPDDMLTVDALVQGNIVTINHNTKLEVELNAPFCNGVVLPGTIMVGFPLFPKLDLEFSNLEDCKFLWEKIKYEDCEKQRNLSQNPLKVIDAQEICDVYSYIPTNNDLGYILKVTCFPKYGDRTGKSLSTESKCAVTAGPGVCPFETRHLYTKKITGRGELRVVSYNILADLYADQDFSRNVLYNYCPPYALSLDYRKPLIITELKGYNSDIICLQEVDAKVFRGDLLPVFETLGFGGAFLPKGGQVVEGSAIFYRKTKCRFVDNHEVLLRHVLDTDPICEDIQTKAYTSETLGERLQSRTTILHVMALEPVDKPGSILLVANTHLYFHPDAGHIRLIQNFTAVRYLEQLVKYYEKQRPCILYCGDFNSTPHRGVYEFMTTKSVREDNIDWKDGKP